MKRSRPSFWMASSLTLCFAITKVLAQATLSHPVTVPLRFVMVGDSERLSIPIKLGNSKYTKNYLFDTGSSALVAAYTPGAPWWGDFNPTEESSTLHYVSTGFQFSTVKIPITLFGKENTVSSSPSFPVDQALNRLVKQSGNWVDDSRWKESLLAAVRFGTPPEDGGHFFGTLGADLQNPSVGLSRFISDVTGGTGGGIISGFALEGGLKNPELILGLSPEIESRFPLQFPINKINQKLSQKVITADFSLEFKGRVYPIGKAGVVLDTGAPRMGIYSTAGFLIPHELMFGRFLRRGVAVHMRCGSLAWTLVAGPGHRVVVREAKGISGVVNSSIHFFENFNVLFDIQHGIIGFAPIR